jgi:hypothetical protein
METASLLVFFAQQQLQLSNVIEEPERTAFE